MGVQGNMAEKATRKQATRRRSPLTRERILRAALKLADERGIEAVSMRALGRALRVEAMSLYRHVADKEAILSGIADLVMGEFEVPVPGEDWRAAVRQSAISAHAALLRHPWAARVIESRSSPGPVSLRYLDAVVGVMLQAGFETQDVARAMMAVDSHTYGFTLQQQAWPIDMERTPEVAAKARDRFAGAYPNLAAMAEMAASGPGAVPIDFEFGLDLILDGLERLRKQG